jgi:hypothetical protein
MPRRRPPPELEAQVLALTAEEWTKRRIAHHLGVGISFVGHVLRRAGIRRREAVDRERRTAAPHRRDYGSRGTEGSKAPAPPPGFDERDLVTGRPYA